MSNSLDVVDGRIYFPPEEKSKPTERKVLHPETNSDNVLCDNGEKTLTDYLGSVPVITNSEVDTEILSGKKDALVFEMVKTE